jgi:coenzyme F420-reducing hydrogenase gamma subunit
MNVKIFQFNGCKKCLNESLLLQKNSEMDIEYIEDPKNWDPKEFDVAIISGYLLPEDREIIEKLREFSTNMVAFGSCTTTGGVYGLLNQKGFNVKPIGNFVENVALVHGCLAEIEELEAAIEGNFPLKREKLCDICERRPTCEYLDEVKRQIDLPDDDTCYNDLGFLCNGFIANNCKEKCIDYGTPCRGCKPMIPRPGIRMLGMFGTLMGNIEVATEASKYGATDKLADKEDDVTRSLPDIVGNFFRFDLADSGLPVGRIPPNGSILGDILIGRLIEEVPLILGLLGGENFITLTLNAIEAYEKSNDIKVTEKTEKYREELLELEGELQKAIEGRNSEKYQVATEKIRKIAGNMNLSNIFFGGFKTPIKDSENFDEYKKEIFEITEGTYENDLIKYSIDQNGVITEFKVKEDLK